ncbi:hypothetical protein GCM10020000_53340 [Streptomyces olivoverticillatus]
MTGQQDTNDRDLLDFPGARRLRAAGKVAPPSADAVAAALAAVRSAAGRAAEEEGPAVELAWEPVAAAVPARRWRRRLPVLASAAAVVAVALGVASQTWSDSGDVHGSPAAVRERTGTGTAPYWKVRTFQWNRRSEKTQRPDESYETVWLSRNGTRGQFGDGPVRDYYRGTWGRRPT